MTPESERQTRTKYIDTKLQARGWHDASQGVSPLLGAYRLPEVETTTGPADYGLYADLGLLAIVEAKKLSVGPQNVLSQAERYAEGVRGPYAVGKFGVPFIYSTNGEVIWFHDLREPLNRSRQVADFHSPAALMEMLAHDEVAALRRLQANPSTHKLLRDYQHEANAAMEQAIVTTSGRCSWRWQPGLARR